MATFGRSFKPVIKPFGDITVFGSPLYLQTGGSVLGGEYGQAETTWAVIRFNNERYEGVTGSQGKIEDGVGKYIFAEKGTHESFYAGEWCASRPDGVGIRQYSDGSTFVGSMHSIKTRTSLPGGLGVCTLANKNWIAGEWEEGKIHGRGMQQTSEGGISTYVGSYSWGLRSGFGVYSFVDGSEYAGEFAADEPHGLGSYTLGRNCFLGKWVNGMRSGWSTFTTDEGSKTWAGRWKEGKLTWSTRLRPVQRAESQFEAEALQRCRLIAVAARAVRDAALKAAEDHCSPTGELQLFVQPLKKMFRYHRCLTAHLLTRLDDITQRAGEAGERAEAASRKARALNPRKWGPRQEDNNRKLKRSHFLFDDGLGGGRPAEPRAC